MKSARSSADLPYWPALMDEQTACAYTSMSPVSFRAVMALKKVAAVDLGLRLLRWRKADLDRAIDSLPVKDSPTRGDDPKVQDINEGAAALTRIREKQRRRG